MSGNRFGKVLHKLKSRLWGDYASGGYTGAGGRNDPAGIIHPAQVFLPRATYDLLGDEAVRKLAGPDAEVTIIEPDD